MKHLISFILSILFSYSAYAQTLAGQDFLGIWRYVTVDLTNDIEHDGYLEYVIDEPPEKFIYPDFPVTGPGKPYITREGSDFVLHLKKKFIEIEMTGQQCTMDLEVPVDKRVLITGSYPDYYCPYYYFIRLMVTL
ncbi:MAG: hypothetical protein ACI30Q_02580 [Muribaculaceae bacterium]